MLINCGVEPEETHDNITAPVDGFAKLSKLVFISIKVTAVLMGITPLNIHESVNGFLNACKVIPVCILVGEGVAIILFPSIILKVVLLVSHEYEEYAN